MKFNLQKIESKTFDDIKIFQPEPFTDYRGDIWTIWEKENILPNDMEFRLSKFAKSTKDVLRGLHGDTKTWKYLSCPYGEVYFVIADARPESKTYLQTETFILNSKNHFGVLVPPGFVNGHLCLSDECLFHYMMSYDGEYVEPHEQIVLHWDDDRLNIDWPINNPILAKRDRS